MKSDNISIKEVESAKYERSTVSVGMEDFPRRSDRGKDFFKKRSFILGRKKRQTAGRHLGPAGWYVKRSVNVKNSTNAWFGIASEVAKAVGAAKRFSWKRMPIFLTCNRHISNSWISGCRKAGYSFKVSSCYQAGARQYQISNLATNMA